MTKRNWHVVTFSRCICNTECPQEALYYHSCNNCNTAPYTYFNAKPIFNTPAVTDICPSMDTYRRTEKHHHFGTLWFTTVLVKPHSYTTWALQHLKFCFYALCIVNNNNPVIVEQVEQLQLWGNAISDGIPVNWHRKYMTLSYLSAGIFPESTFSDSWVCCFHCRCCYNHWSAQPARRSTFRRRFYAIARRDCSFADICQRFNDRRQAAGVAMLLSSWWNAVAKTVANSVYLVRAPVSTLSCLSRPRLYRLSASLAGTSVERRAAEIVKTRN